MIKLTLQTDSEFFNDNTYSICLCNAREYSIDKQLLIETTAGRKLIASVVSQAQYRFSDLTAADCKDNYDSTARTIYGLEHAMTNAYPAFDTRMIVTILRFKIMSRG